MNNANIFKKIESNLKSNVYLFTHRDLDLDLDAYCSTISFANYLKEKYRSNVTCIIDINSILYDGKIYVDIETFI